MPTALIWGASGGIGSALTKHLKENNWHVYGAARNRDAIPAEADMKLDFDAGDPSTVKEVSILLAEDGAELDLVVYAAGGIIADKVTSLGEENWGEVMDANLNGAYMALQNVVHLVKQGGHLMVIGAYVDKIMLPKFGAYATAKAGLEPLMTVLSKENRKINFTVVRPPAVESAFWDHVPFNMPDGALKPQAVAQSILTHYTSGGNGDLDL